MGLEGDFLNALNQQGFNESELMNKLQPNRKAPLSKSLPPPSSERMTPVPPDDALHTMVGIVSRPKNMATLSSTGRAHMRQLATSLDAKAPKTQKGIFSWFSSSSTKDSAKILATVDKIDKERLLALLDKELNGAEKEELHLLLALGTIDKLSKSEKSKLSSLMSNTAFVKELMDSTEAKHQKALKNLVKHAYTSGQLSLLFNNLEIRPALIQPYIEEAMRSSLSRTGLFSRLFGTSVPLSLRVPVDKDKASNESLHKLVSRVCFEVVLASPVSLHLDNEALNRFLTGAKEEYERISTPAASNQPIKAKIALFLSTLEGSKPIARKCTELKKIANDLRSQSKQFCLYASFYRLLLKSKIQGMASKEAGPDINKLLLGRMDAYEIKEKFPLELQRAYQEYQLLNSAIDKRQKVDANVNFFMQLGGNLHSVNSQYDLSKDLDLMMLEILKSNYKDNFERVKSSEEKVNKLFKQVEQNPRKGEVLRYFTDTSKTSDQKLKKASEYLQSEVRQFKKRGETGPLGADDLKECAVAFVISIPEEHREKFFDSFMQIPEPRKEEAEKMTAWGHIRDALLIVSSSQVRL